MPLPKIPVVETLDPKLNTQSCSLTDSIQPTPNHLGSSIIATLSTHLMVTCSRTNSNPKSSTLRVIPCPYLLKKLYLPMIVIPLSTHIGVRLCPRSLMSYFLAFGLLFLFLQTVELLSVNENFGSSIILTAPQEGIDYLRPLVR